jgi:hypothetical protein
MAAIDFPDSPTVNQTVTRGGYLWQWTGVAWKKVLTSTAGAPTFYGLNFEATTGALRADILAVDTETPEIDSSVYFEWFTFGSTDLNFEIINDRLIMEGS